MCTGGNYERPLTSESEDDTLDLSGQLARRREDQSLCLTDASVDRLQDRDGECSGLSGTRLSLDALMVS